MFKKPKALSLDKFFEFHPRQPDIQIPFVSNKVFFKEDKTQRYWLSYSGEALFCSICLAFSNENNVFTLGMSTWTHVYQRIKEHENSKCHNRCTEAYFLNHNKKNIDFLLFSNQLSKRKETVKKNRQILERVIDAVKLIGKRGLSYRGNYHEAAYTLDNSSLDHGNFLEILLLIRKSDVVLNEHLETVIKKSKASHESGNKNRGGLLTLISKTTVNLFIECISQEIKRIIVQEVQEAGMFSIELDTTQDVSVKDQCSVVIRYVNKNGVQERLISVVNCIDSSGKGIFELLQKVISDNNLNIENCIANATDGAASMQGKYNGFSAWLANASPGQMHVWCYSHVLNLVITDATKISIAAASLFSMLNSLAVFFKESHKRMTIWTNSNQDNNTKRLQSIGDTRWWSKNISLQRIFGTPNNAKEALYVNVLISLSTIANSSQFSPEIRAKSTNLKESLLKYSTLLTAFLYMRIFEKTTPLSNYLQTSGMDIQKAHSMVEKTLSELKLLKRDENGLKKCVDEFIMVSNAKLDNYQDENNDFNLTIEQCLPALRIRKKKAF